MPTVWGTAAITVYLVILVVSLSTPLLSAFKADSSASRNMQVMLWIGLTFVVLELAGLTAVAVARIVLFPQSSGLDALRIGLLTFVFAAHGIWLFFGLGTLRASASSVRGPGTLLLGLSSLFATICFASTLFLAIRAGVGTDAWATVLAIVIAVLGLLPLFLFLVLVLSERRDRRLTTPPTPDSGSGPSGG